MTGTKCRGICDIPGYDFVKSSSYQDGKLNYCSICIAYVKSQSKCPCCKLKLRTKSKATKDKRTKEGDEALTFFDLAIKRAKFELGLLRIGHKIPGLGNNINESVRRHLLEAVHQYEVIKENKRQRPEYLKAKYELMEKLIARIRKETVIFHEKSV